MAKGSSPYFDCEFTVDDHDFTFNLRSVTIVGSIYAVYQTVFIKFEIDYQDIIEYDLHGQQDVKIKIREMTEDKQVREEHTIDLVVVKVVSSGMSRRKGEEQDHMLKDSMLYVCIPKNAFEGITSTINYISQDKTPYDAATDIVNKFMKTAQTKNIDDNNKNTYKHEQIIVAPMAISAALDFLDTRYGIYKGPLFYTFRFEEDTFCMWDLSKKIEDDEEYTVYVLTSGEDDREIMREVGKDEESFYTYQPLNITQKNEQNVMKTSFENKYISKPMDSFFKTITVKTQDIFDKVLPKDGGDLKVHDIIKGMKDFHARDMVGSGDDDGFATSSLSKNLMFQTETSVSFHRNLRLKRLFRVGVPINLKPKAMKYIDYSGKYLVKSSVVKISRDGRGVFNATADIQLFRSNDKR